IALLRHLTVLSLVAPSLLVPSSAAVSFIYNGFQHAADLSLDGSASILRGGALQLTNDSNNLMGHAFFAGSVPMLVNKAVISFSTAFVSDIVTVGRSGGHGLAFVVTTSKVLSGTDNGKDLASSAKEIWETPRTMFSPSSSTGAGERAPERDERQPRRRRLEQPRVHRVGAGRLLHRRRQQERLRAARKRSRSRRVWTMTAPPRSSS
uniref:Legume lectin domain-containing protein n=1 Tax=Aegilops tauschii subsp. strangulata TaxID=200361 RepID=A0A452YP88_AEGTS